MRRHLGTLLLLVLAAPATTRAQDPRLASRLPAPVLGRVEVVIDSARHAGLPVEPLVDRALEGASKRADGDRIVAAVRRLAGELAAARDALGPTAGDPEIAAGASALRAGARTDDLTRLRERRGGRPVTVAAAVLTDLVALGVPADTATAAVLALADHAEDATYLAFRRSVERDVALGATPVAALLFRAADAGFGTGVEANRPRKP
jgi:hypothetical protein